MAKKQYLFSASRFRNVLWAHRQSLGHNQGQAAKECGMTLNKYHRLEFGKQEPSASDLASACNYINVNPLDFFGVKEKPLDAKEQH